MNFLQQLNEAANIPLDQLKDRMKKDPRVKMVFQRDLQLDQLKDPVEFAKTIHFYIFNNPQVRAYIEKRADRRDVSKHWFKRMANSSNPTQKLTQNEIVWLQDLVKGLFKDVTYVQKKDISKRGYENLMMFFNGTHNILDAYAAKEVESLDMKPGGPVTLYRGLLFDDFSLRTGDRFGYGAGLKFLAAVRKGKRTVDLDYGNHTIWTKDKKRALAQALYGSDAPWHNPDSIKDPKIEKHRGKMAFVISTLAGPDDVVVDLSEFSKVYNWPPKNQTGYSAVILKPGKRLARIVSKYTQEGEEDPISQDETEDLGDIEQLLTMFGRILKLPMEIEYEGLSRFTHDPDIMKQVGVLIDPAFKERLAKLLNSTVSFYQKHLKDLDLTKLAQQSGKHKATYAALRTIADSFDGFVRHEDYGDPNALRLRDRQAGTPYIRDLKKGEDMLTAFSPEMMAEDVAKVIAAQKRWTDRKISSAIRGYAKVADPNLTFPEKVHLSGWAVQKPLLDAAVDGFYQVVGKPKPASHVEQAKDFLSVSNEAAIVARAAHFLQLVRTAALSAGQ